MIECYYRHGSDPLHNEGIDPKVEHTRRLQNYEHYRFHIDKRLSRLLLQ